MILKEYSLGGDQIITCKVPQYEEWIMSALHELETEKKNFQFSHQIGGRWENSYLSVITYLRFVYPCVWPEIWQKKNGAFLRLLSMKHDRFLIIQILPFGLISRKLEKKQEFMTMQSLPQFLEWYICNVLQNVVICFSLSAGKIISPSPQRLGKWFFSPPS